jgi:hypothetical protein
MNPLITQAGPKLSGIGGYVLVDRVSGRIIAEANDTFKLEAIAVVYRIQLERSVDIRQKVLTDETL